MSFFSHGQGISIDRSSMTDIAGGQSNVNIMVTTSHGSAGDNAREPPLRTPIAPTSSDAEVYARQLLLKRHGYPLWYPEPYGYTTVYRTKGVRIGDVGYVTSDGAFETLFNIRASAQDPINERGVPENFEQVQISAYDIVHAPHYHQRNGVVTSFSSQRVSFGVDFSTLGNPLIPTEVGSGYQFVWSTSEGAILHLPQGASRLNCPPERFKSYAIKHAFSWYKFANQIHHRGVPNGSLYIITGTDKTSSWMVGAFSNAPPGDQVSLQLSAARNNGGSTSFNYCWETASAPVCRTGASSNDGIGNVIASDMDIDRDDAVFRGDAPGNQNHCVFLRGYTILLNYAVAALHGVQWGAGVLPIKDTCPDNTSAITNDVPFSGSSTLTSMGGRSGGGGLGLGSSPCQVTASNDYEASKALGDCFAIVEPLSGHSEPYHPSVVINKHLLESSPNAAVAITHDDDWIGLIRGNDTAFPTDSELVSRLGLVPYKSPIVEEFGGVPAIHLGLTGTRNMLRDLVCHRCRVLRVKCLVLHNSMECKRCENGGHICTFEAVDHVDEDTDIEQVEASVCHRCRVLGVKCLVLHNSMGCKRCENDGYICTFEAVDNVDEDTGIEEVMNQPSQKAKKPPMLS